MTTGAWRQDWLGFCRDHGLGRSPVPLFEVSGGAVQTVPRGRAGQPVLARSEAMERLVTEEVQKVVTDYATNEHEGVIYCMYELVDSSPAPLYIGKAEKFGKKGGNLSANMIGIQPKASGPFARWGYSYAYHLGDLSAVVIPHADPGKGAKYRRWAAELFVEPWSERRLKRPVYFWMKAWKSGTPGPGPYRDRPMALTALEYALIMTASHVFPRLLNAEGVNRPTG